MKMPMYIKHTSTNNDITMLPLKITGKSTDNKIVFAQAITPKTGMGRFTKFYAWNEIDKEWFYLGIRHSTRQIPNWKCKIRLDERIADGSFPI